MIPKVEQKFPRKGSAPPVDPFALERELKRAVAGEVRFDQGSRALYATDASNYRQVPLGVVIPRTLDDVIAAVAVCARHGAPLTSRGGGTSLAGQTCNTGVILDHSKYLHAVEEIDAEGEAAWVQPGVTMDKLRESAHAFGLTFAPDPATHSHCTLGGMLGNNSCGPHSVWGGKTDENTLALDVLTYDGLRMTVGPTTAAERSALAAEAGRKGQIFADLDRYVARYADQIRKTFPDIPRRVSGYNLPWLLPERGSNLARALVGSEGTLVTILRAKMRLLPYPSQQVLVVLGYPDVYAAGDHVPEIMRFGPKALEGIDEVLVQDIETAGLQPRNLAYLPEGKGWLIVEFGDPSRKIAEEQAQAMISALRAKGSQAPTIKLYDDRIAEGAVWKIRESGLGATAKVPGKPDTWEGWEDSAVPPEQVGTYLRRLRQLFDRFGYSCALYGHFGQGCIHTRIDFDLKTPTGIRTFREFLNQAAELCVSLGGSLSGEHGDGQARAELLPVMFGPQMVAGFSEFKAIFDPAGKMNPGKMVEPRPITGDLRISSYDPIEPKVAFSYPEDHGSFAAAANRCVGVGNCRQEKGGTMCPSYMATREEAHSTRGRARLLWEMLRGQTLTEGWKSKAVNDALDLCLACKGCKGECPVHVDMATYKAEFLSHYYAGRIRPRHMFAFGFIPWWTRRVGRIPWLINAVTQTPGLADLAKLAANMHPARRIPALADEPFHVWFDRNKRPLTSLASPNGGPGSRAKASAEDKQRERPARPDVAQRTVLLWPDTFNDYFMPHTARAAMEVLEAAGFAVNIPAKPWCCGRPLYDYGFVPQARKLLVKLLDGLREIAHDDISIVFLEPSCCSVFRDELLSLFPDDPVARKLSSHAYLLSEFLVEQAPDWKPPRLQRKAVVLGHCHHKSILKMAAETRILDAVFGPDYQLLDTSCCGMAGAFGFEKDHYDVAMKLAEQVLLPAIREASPETLVVADGFSCREQILQSSDRRALHLAEVLQLAIRQDAGVPAWHPEDAVLPPRSETSGRSRAAATAAASVAAIAVGTILVVRALSARADHAQGSR